MSLQNHAPQATASRMIGRELRQARTCPGLSGADVTGIRSISALPSRAEVPARQRIRSFYARTGSAICPGHHVPECGSRVIDGATVALTLRPAVRMPIPCVLPVQVRETGHDSKGRSLSVAGLVSARRHGRRPGCQQPAPAARYGVAEMMKMIALELPDLRLHIIAHSMGAEIGLSVLAELARRGPTASQIRRTHSFTCGRGSGTLGSCHARHQDTRSLCDLLFKRRGELADFGGMRWVRILTVQQTLEPYGDGRPEVTGPPN